MKRLHSNWFVVLVLAMSALATAALASTGDVCGDPQKPCPDPESLKFDAWEMTFRVPKQMEWMKEYQSKPFYAVFLQSVKAEPDDGPHGDKRCGGYFDERQRLAAQKLFPTNKVFASRHGCSINGAVYYPGANRDYNFLAVYAGATKAEAENMLTKVKTTGKYPGANLRRIRAAMIFGD